MDHRRPAVFLDRDGVINVNRVDHVKSWEEFRFLPGALESLALLAALPCPLVVITNQSAVGRGLLSLGELEAIHRRMVEIITAHGGRIDAAYVCPHTPWDGCDCRKPRPGLLLRAARALDIDLTRSVMLGDRPSDIEAGREAGCMTVWVTDAPTPPEAADFVSAELADAVQWITRTMLSGASPVGG